jgi:hypothetical protein
VVAVESSNEAVLELNRAYPGLKILEHKLEDLLQVSTDLAWPSKANRPWFRARVVNLDLTQSLRAEVRQGQLVFPVLRIVEKVARLHAEEPCVDWTLCLTLHGEIHWSAQADAMACQFLAGNFRDHPTFCEQARAVLGDPLHADICSRPTKVRVSELSVPHQGAILKMLVPKRIAFDSHQRGWLVATVENLSYGGVEGRAPMVSWIMRFSWDPRASTEAAALYRESLGTALENHGHIDGEGGVQRG